MTALCASVGFTAPAAAQELQTVTLLANAESGCTLADPELATDGVLVNFVGPTGNVYRVQELADPATLTTRAAHLRLDMAAMCNSAHRVVVTSQNSGLWRTGPAPTVVGNFGTAVPYQLQISWADTNQTLVAQAVDRQERQWEILVGHPNVGALELDFNITAGQTNAGLGAPMVAGGYSDVVTVRVEPQ